MQPGTKILLALLALGAPLRAQAVDLVGKVEKATNRCSARITHKLRCSNIYLHAASPSVDLVKLEGKVVQLVGTLGLAPCILVGVTRATLSPHALTIASTGSFRPGSNVVFRTSAPLLSVVPTIVAAHRFFLPLGDFGHLGIAPPWIWVNTKLALFGFASTSLPIPKDRNLIGARFYSQGIYFSPLMQTGRLLNVECFRVQAP